jgi:hypothetical protein
MYDTLLFIISVAFYIAWSARFKGYEAFLVDAACERTQLSVIIFACYGRNGLGTFCVLAYIYLFGICGFGIASNNKKDNA